MTCKQCDGLANWKDTYAWLHEFNYHRAQHEKLKKQVAALELENNKLKESVVAWKNAWFHLRDIIGNLWWHHPGLKPNSEPIKDWGVWVQPRKLLPRFQICNGEVARFTKDEAIHWAEDCNNDTGTSSKYTARKL